MRLSIYRHIEMGYTIVHESFCLSETKEEKERKRKRNNNKKSIRKTAALSFRQQKNPICICFKPCVCCMRHLPS
jgi:hypothetical protein